MIFTSSARLLVAIMVILSFSVCKGILQNVAVARQGYGDEDSYVFEDSEDSSGDDDLEGSSYVDEYDESTIEETVEENILMTVDPDEDDIVSLTEEDSDLVIEEYEEDDGYRRKR